jgi:hypothetical protein
MRFGAETVPALSNMMDTLGCQTTLTVTSPWHYKRNMNGKLWRSLVGKLLGTQQTWVKPVVNLCLFLSRGGLDEITLSGTATAPGLLPGILNQFPPMCGSVDVV